MALQQISSNLLRINSKGFMLYGDRAAEIIRPSVYIGVIFCWFLATNLILSKKTSSFRSNFLFSVLLHILIHLVCHLLGVLYKFLVTFRRGCQIVILLREIDGFGRYL